MLFKPVRNHKLEKADILEMTVNHLRSLQKQKLVSASASDPMALARYKQGYTECVQECVSFMNSKPRDLTGAGMDQATKQRLLMNLVKQFQAAGSSGHLPKLELSSDSGNQQQQDTSFRRDSVSPISGTSECSSHSAANYYSSLNQSSSSNEQGVASPGEGSSESFNEQNSSEPSSPKILEDKEGGKATWRPW